MSAVRSPIFDAPDLLTVRSCPQHGPVEGAGEPTCPALVTRMIAGELEIVRCGRLLEAELPEIAAGMPIAHPDARRRHAHLHAFTDRLRRRKRVLVS